VEQEGIGVTAALKKVAVGSAYFHLYFIVLIIQFYLLFPFILRFLIRFKGHHRELLALFFIVNLLVILVYYYHFDMPERIPRRFFPFWIFYFILGSVIGLNIEYYKNKIRNVSFGVLGIFFFIASEEHIFSFYLEGLAVDNPSDIFYMRPESLLYSTIAIILSIKLSEELSHHSNRILQILREMGKASFGIYLIHILFLKATLYLYKILGVSKGFASHLFLFLIALSLSMLSVKAINNLSIGRYIFGAAR
jgi:peptidoglycan/LPS O-acetylase OafA/YrhL